uniref:Putative secreted protein n=1 Tax=Anopheles triannulatus TaxID=58253 RepID=A0A2M4B783_9DIPT
MNHLLLQLLLHLELAAHQQILAHLHEGAAHPYHGHDEYLHTNQVHAQLYQHPDQDDFVEKRVVVAVSGRLTVR